MSVAEALRRHLEAPPEACACHKSRFVDRVRLRLLDLLDGR